jgi:WD40 repeat protein
VVAGDQDGSIKVANLGERTLDEGVLGVSHDGINDLAPLESAGGAAAMACGNDGAVSLWDLTTSTQTQYAHALDYGAATSIAILRDRLGRPFVVVGGQERSIRMLSLPDMSVIDRRTFDSGVTSLSKLPFHHMGLVVGLADGRVALSRDLSRGAESWEFVDAHDQDVTGIRAIVVGGRIVLTSISLDRSLRVWDLSTRIQLQRIDLDGQALCLDAMGPYVAVGTTGGASVLALHQDPLVLAGSTGVMRELL